MAVHCERWSFEHEANHLASVRLSQFPAEAAVSVLSVRDILHAATRVLQVLELLCLPAQLRGVVNGPLTARIVPRLSVMRGSAPRTCSASARLGWMIVTCALRFCPSCLMCFGTIL